MSTKLKSFLDERLESDARDVEEWIEAIEQNQDYESIRALARAIQRLNYEIAKTLSFYGDEYEERGSKFTILGDRAIRVAALVPEQITRTNKKGDRSAHALITRSAMEIAECVKTTCQ